MATATMLEVPLVRAGLSRSKQTIRVTRYFARSVMTETTLDANVEVRLPESPPSKFEREKRAFLRLLPSLLATHPGRYVAIHDEQVVDSDSDQVELALRVQRQVGPVAIYVHLVNADQPTTCRSGVVRDLSQG